MNRLGKFAPVSYDDVILSPADTGECSICLTAPQIDVLLGLLEPLVWVTRWASDSDTEIDQDVIEAFTDELRRRLMANCQEVVLARFDTNGHYQTSVDGGATWADNPTADPRNGYYVLPNLAGDDGATKKCTASNSVVTYLKNAVASIQKAKDNEATASDLGAVLIGLLILLGIITAGWAFAFLGALVALIYANVSAAEWAAAFTSDVWQVVLCALYCNMSDSGAFDDAGWLQVKADVDAGLSPGVAESFFLEMINALSWQGLNTAVNQNLGGELSCDACCASCDIHDWGDYREGYTPFGGQDISYNDATNEITITLGNAGSDYRFYLAYKATLQNDGGLTNVVHNDLCWIAYDGGSPNKSGGDASYDDRSGVGANPDYYWLFEFVSNTPDVHVLQVSTPP